MFLPQNAILPSYNTADWWGPATTDIFNDNLEGTECTCIGFKARPFWFNSWYFGKPSEILPHAKTLPLLQTAREWVFPRLTSTIVLFVISLTRTGLVTLLHYSYVNPTPNFPCLFEPIMNKKPSSVMNPVLSLPQLTLIILRSNERDVKSGMNKDFYECEWPPSLF